MNFYYVYAYLDPRKPGDYKYGDYKFEYEPFYIGKGTKSRMLRHLKNESRNPIKQNKISKIRSVGLYPIIIKIVDNISNEESLEIEKELIKIIGRHSKKEGPLTNYSSGGETYLGYKHQEEYINKLKKPVVKYDILGNKLDEYDSVAEAGKKNNVPPQTISQICNGDIKIYKDKYIFLYKGDKFIERKRRKKEYQVVRIDYNLDKKEYESLTKASIDNNLTPSNINSVCMGKVFQSGGYLWRYKNHPVIEKYNDIIKIKFQKYIDILDKKVKYNDIIYRNILHVIFKNKHLKVGNLYQLLNNDSKNIFRYNEFKTN